MSVDFIINRAIQIPSSSGFAAQEIFMHSTHLLGRIGRAVGNRLSGVHALSGGIFTQALVGRAAFLTAIGLSCASFIAHYQAGTHYMSCFLPTSMVIPVCAFLGKAM